MALPDCTLLWATISNINSHLMIYSMTGYGTARRDTESALINIEIKTLNSKFFDLQAKFPKEFGEYEPEIRNVLTEKLKRGKVIATFDYQPKSRSTAKVSINKDMFMAYFTELKTLAEQTGVPLTDNIFKSIMSMPDVIVQQESASAADDWPVVIEALNVAIDHCLTFRLQEGSTISSNLASYISTIDTHLGVIAAQDPNRVLKIKERIGTNLADLVGRERVDQNRFEQEIIYYIEKIDITEEKLRLKTHLDYFLQVMASEESPGKKLGFVAQEIGREINTIGSKANDAIMQREVVNMKEELEKIKEQLLNIM